MDGAMVSRCPDDYKLIRPNGLAFGVRIGVKFLKFIIGKIGEKKGIELHKQYNFLPSL